MKKNKTIIFIAILFIVLGAVLMGGCTSKKTAQEGDKVSVYYVGKFDNGTTFDQNVGKELFTIVLGQGQAIPGFENAIYGMAVGEKKTVRIPPEQAYPNPDPNRILSFDRAELADFENTYGLKVGQEIYVSFGGDPIRGVIIEIKPDIVVIDFNPPVVGQYLNFEIELVKIE